MSPLMSMLTTPLTPVGKVVVLSAGAAVAAVAWRLAYVHKPDMPADPDDCKTQEQIDRTW